MNILLSITLYVAAYHGLQYFALLVTLSLFTCVLLGGIFYQKRVGRRLRNEYRSLLQIKSHGVQQELVLKAMKLATWKMDVATRAVTYDFDFRDRADIYVPSPGVSLDELYMHVHPDDVKHVNKALEDLCAGRVDEYCQQYRILLPHTDQSIWEESYATVADRDINGNPTSLVGTSSFINEKKKMEQDLIDARNKAEESDLLKSSFIANISHEVRTPLNAIVGFSDLLPTITDEKEREHLISIIKENNAKLVRIFEDMMEMSKVEASKEKDVLNVTEFDIVEVLNEIVRKFAALNKKSSLEISGQIRDEELIVRSDRDRIVQVVEHFMDNAVKFTETGSIVLEMTSDAGSVKISVTDTGCGIPKHAIDRIFDRFYKINSFVQGAGLGLAVCRSYTYSIGGLIGVDSKEGIGSTFWIKIPQRI